MYGLIATSALSILAYLVLTVAVIFATSHRTSAARESATLVSQIGELESAYLTYQREITPERAHALGLVIPASVVSSPADANAVAYTFAR